jgi:hypothetical protein
MKLLIVDYRITPKCESFLLKEGFSLLKLPPDNLLGEAISSHPDTVMFHLNGNIITTADYCDTAPYIFSDIRELCPEVKIHFTSDRRSATYPHDCVMNALVIGNKLFCKRDSVSEVIIRLADDMGYEIYHTSQGYPACSVLAFGNNAITADRGLGRLMEEVGISVTYINQGGISLPPYEYGFIGGASGVVGNKVYFFGDISKHPDGEIICKTIKESGYIPISLSDEALSDFGGVISL